jgi:hypothetical protein
MNPTIFDNLVTLTVGAVHRLLLLCVGGRIVPLPFMDYRNLYGLRTWIEYSFKQIKNELGWADHHLTAYAAIEHW